MPEQTPSESSTPANPPHLSVRDMYVVSMPSPGENNLIKPWLGMESLLAVEECARFTFVLTPEEVEALPPIVHRLATEHMQEYRNNQHRVIPVRIEKGPRAYSRLLKLALGLEDMKDDFVRADQLYVRPEWKRYQETHPQEAKKFETIMKWFSRDFKRINAETDFLTMPKPTQELAVKKFLNLQGGENILLVADKFGITESSAKAIAQASALSDTITITHADPKELAERYKELKKLQTDKVISNNIHIVALPFEDALQQENMEKFNHAVVCMPIGKDAAKDQALIDAWKNRERQDGIIIHRKGNPQERQEMTAPWNQPGISNLFGPDAMEIKRQSIVNYNEQTCESVRRMCVRSAANRLSESIALEMFRADPAQGKFTRALAIRTPDTRGNNPRNGNGNAGKTNGGGVTK